VGIISRSHKDRSLRRDRVSTALRVRVAVYSRRRGLGSIHDLASAVGFVVSVISKMRSGLSIRGTTRRWWRKARTVAAVSPRPARYLSTARSESNCL
jgi:hypothetical protein